MSYPIIIARASGGRPLRRAAIEASERVTYIANPDRIDAVKAGDSDPVGFPNYDIFEFDADLYARLNDAWRSEQTSELAELWKKARAFDGARNA